MSRGKSCREKKEMGCVSSDIKGCALQKRNFFFFQAEDGIRDVAVTGVQTCALPISTIQRWLINTSATTCLVIPSRESRSKRRTRRSEARARFKKAFVAVPHTFRSCA